MSKCNRLKLSSSAGHLKVLRRQGSRNAAPLVDSRLRGNDIKERKVGWSVPTNSKYGVQSIPYLLVDSRFRGNDIEESK